MLVKIAKETKLLFLFSLCALLRPSENVAIKWDYIDINQRIITIPPDRMKMKREFRVPISSLVSVSIAPSTVVALVVPSI